MSSDTEESESGGGGGGGIDLFQEPDDYYPPAKEATFETHRMDGGEELRVRLVGFNPLWGHHIWQAGRTISSYLESRSSLIAGKTVLEFGAGAGLPSLVCARLGASKVVVTDYPDAELVENMAWNVRECCGEEAEREGRVAVMGYLWGAPAAPLLSHLPSPSSGFDTLILADLLFNHSEHAKLLSSLRATLSRTNPAAVALVFFSPYRPWLFDKDMAFFDLVRGAGMRVEKVWESVLERVMFEGDRGDELLRRTVFGFEVRWGEGEGEKDGVGE